MQKTWNYLFYSTWKLHNRASEIFIFPLIFIFNKISFFRKNWHSKGEEEYNRIIKSKDLGLNVLFSYYCMLMTTSIIYSVFFMYVWYALQIEVGNNIYYYFIAVVVLSYLTNEILSWRKDVYLKYFTEFDKVNNKSLIYLPAILFHLGVAVFAVLSIHWTIGFSF